MHTRCFLLITDTPKLTVIERLRPFKLNPSKYSFVCRMVILIIYPSLNSSLLRRVCASLVRIVSLTIPRIFIKHPMENMRLVLPWHVLIQIPLQQSQSLHLDIMLYCIILRVYLFERYIFLPCCS